MQQQQIGSKRSRSVKIWVTRTQAAERLGCTPQGIRYLVQKGVLTEVPVAEAVGYVPRRNPNGGKLPRKVLDLSNIEQALQQPTLQRANAGRIAAEAWRLFAAGKSLVETVIELHIVPEQARNLYEAFCESRDCVILPVQCVELLRELGFQNVDKQSFAQVLEKVLVLARAAQAKDKRAVLEDL